MARQVSTHPATYVEMSSNDEYAHQINMADDNHTARVVLLKLFLLALHAGRTDVAYSRRGQALKHANTAV